MIYVTYRYVLIKYIFGIFFMQLKGKAAQSFMHNGSIVKLHELDPLSDIPDWV